VLCWGAPRLEWLGRQGLWDADADAICSVPCTGLLFLLRHSGHSTVMSAAQAGLPQLVQQVLQHCRDKGALYAASQLLVLLRDPSIQSMQAHNQGAADVLRQLQPGGHPGRAAAIAALLSELRGEASQQAGVAPPAARPSSSGRAAQQAGGQEEAVPAQCAACHALPPAGRKFQVCAGCRAVRYCSPACQKAAWRSGHKAECRAAQSGAQGRA
jgi:hypothetical protein